MKRAGSLWPLVSLASPGLQPPSMRHSATSSWPRGAVDRAVDPATAEQAGVGGIHDGVDGELGDVALDNLDDDLDRRAAQAAGCLQGMPAPARCSDSSPDWNISRMMSQPPMNSPLT